MPRSLRERIEREVDQWISFHGFCFRYVRPRYGLRNKALSAYGSYYTGGRFNLQKTFQVLYTSCDPHTALEEVCHSFSRSGFDVAKSLPRTVIGIEARLQRILDLTDSQVRSRLRITRSLLIKTDWEHYQNNLQEESPTQAIGRFAHEAGFEAMRVPSAARSSGVNLNIFLDNLLPGSRVKMVNMDELPETFP